MYTAKQIQHIVANAESLVALSNALLKSAEKREATIGRERSLHHDNIESTVRQIEALLAPLRLTEQFCPNCEMTFPTDCVQKDES